MTNGVRGSNSGPPGSVQGTVPVYQNGLSIPKTVRFVPIARAMVSTYSPAFTHLPRIKATQAFFTDVNHAVVCAVRPGCVRKCTDHGLPHTWRMRNPSTMREQTRKQASLHTSAAKHKIAGAVSESLCCMSASHGPKPHR